MLTKPTNGFVTITNGNRCGSAAFFQCEDGFGLLGSVYRDCREIGEWRGVQPSCHGRSFMSIGSPYACNGPC